jgi:hypothetical protein
MKVETKAAGKKILLLTSEAGLVTLLTIAALYILAIAFERDFNL